MKLKEILIEGTISPEDKKILDTIVKWHERNFDISGVAIPKKYQTKEHDNYYRGIVLNRENFDALEDGDSVTLPSKGFSSWTLDFEVAKQFATGAGASTGVVIKKDGSDLEVVLNIETFFFLTKLDITKYLDRPDEQEIIVKDKPKSLIITRRDLADI